MGGMSDGHSLFFPGQLPCDAITLPEYDPLHDDAQAMALVKKFRLSLTAEHQGGWIVNRNTDEIEVRNQWANRAVVEWVAKMQKAVQATHFLGA
jgi:hypothetical protein